MFSATILGLVINDFLRCTYLLWVFATVATRAVSQLPRARWSVDSAAVYLYQLMLLWFGVFIFVVLRVFFNSVVRGDTERRSNVGVVVFQCQSV